MLRKPAPLNWNYCMARRTMKRPTALVHISVLISHPPLKKWTKIHQDGRDAAPPKQTLARGITDQRSTFLGFVTSRSLNRDDQGSRSSMQGAQDQENSRTQGRDREVLKPFSISYRRLETGSIQVDAVSAPELFFPLHSNSKRNSRTQAQINLEKPHATALREAGLNRQGPFYQD